MRTLCLSALQGSGRPRNANRVSRCNAEEPPKSDSSTARSLPWLNEQTHAASMPRKGNAPTPPCRRAGDHRFRRAYRSAFPGFPARVCAACSGAVIPRPSALSCQRFHPIRTLPNAPLSPQRESICLFDIPNKSLTFAVLTVNEIPARLLQKRVTFVG